MNNTFSIVRPVSVMLLLLTLLCGGIYPLLCTGLIQALFLNQSTGSLIYDHQGQVVGSDLIGQSFTDPKYFWGRLSATSGTPYNGMMSGGSNLAPSNPTLETAVKARIEALKQADPTQTQPIPVDLVTTSASGLDSDISIAAALYQAPRIARIRGLTEQQVHTIIEKQTQNRQFGILGEPRVNVLKLNLALDGKI